MKKIFRILLIAFLVFNISTIYVHSETVNLIEEKLDSIGISDEYSNNIVNYITNLKLSNEEINNNTVDNNYDDSNNTRFNTVSAIKSKNMNRVLSIIFLVLFSCVVVSLLIDSIFFRDKN